jgi:Ca-activated chloride channel homolog
MNFSSYLSYLNVLPWDYEFLAPINFLFLFIIPLFLFLLQNKELKSKGELKFSGLKNNLINIKDAKSEFLSKNLKYLYAIAILFLVVSLTKPHFKSGFTDEKNYKYKNGIDIIIAMDISLSMLARDFEPNRLEAAKSLAKEFVDSREGDRIGLVAYEGESYTPCPSTLDYSILKQQIDNLQPGVVEGGTAIGTGLGTAVTRLRNDSLPSKVIILLTDGVNNQGELSPIMAAQLAKSKKIKVYTIGIGTLGTAPSPIFTPFGIQYENIPVEIDEKTLTEIANLTGGKYFRATDENSLRSIYKEIDKLEKRQMKAIDSNNEIPIQPIPFLIWSILFLFATIYIQFVYLKKDEI